MIGLRLVSVPALDGPVLRVADVQQVERHDMAVAEQDVRQIRSVPVYRGDEAGMALIPADPIDEDIVRRA